MKTRIITGIIGAAAFLGLLQAGGWWTKGFVLALAVVGYYELLRMGGMKWPDPFMWTGIPLIALLFVGVVTTTSMLIAALVYALVFLSVRHVSFEQVSLSMFGLVYAGIGFYGAWQVYDKLGFFRVFFVLLCIWATDSGAYFIGKKWGKRPIAPAVSPNKTFEGCVGGALCAACVGSLWMCFSPYNEPFAIPLAILFSLLGQIGDLAESALKRHFKVKDSGSILPGHGGVLDRFDSFLFVNICLYVCLLFPHT